METIKLKILDEVGHTLMTCDADTNVSLVYTNSYKPVTGWRWKSTIPGNTASFSLRTPCPKPLCMW